MKSIILESSLSWFWKHKPDIILSFMIVAGIAWVSISANNFAHRIDKTEQLVNDINNRQLPEIRTELKEARKDVNDLRSEMNDRMQKIETQLATIITYLNTKEK